MKYLSALFLMLFAFSTVFSQDWSSSNAIQGTGDIKVIYSSGGSDGSIIVMGYFSGTMEAGTPNETTSAGGTDYFIAKFALDMSLSWIRQVASPLDVYVFGGIDVDASDNIYVTGGYRTSATVTGLPVLNSTGVHDSFLAKFTSDGTPVFLMNVAYGGKRERPNTLAVDQSGDVLLSGFYQDSVTFDGGLTLYNDDAVTDYFYGKFSPADGSPIWVKQIRAVSGVTGTHNFAGRIFSITDNGTAYFMSGLYNDSVFIENDTLFATPTDTADVHVIKTDHDGNVEWIRTIGGVQSEYSYTITHDDYGAVYVAGYFDSPTLIVDSTDTDVVTKPGTEGRDDIFIVKYDSFGVMEWAHTVGGRDTDKVFDIDITNDTVWVAGVFSDSLQWGPIKLKTDGLLDQDMFYGSITLDGNLSSANSTSGKVGEQSIEEARAIYSLGGKLSVVIASNTTFLELGDADYFNASGVYFVAVGIVGCRPLSFSTNPDDVEGCYGDNKGIVLFLPSATQPGFGPPYKYYVNNKEVPQYCDTLFAGTYTTGISDKENCYAPGSSITINQPQPITFTVSSSDATCFDLADGSIEFSGATGGVQPYSYSIDDTTTLQFTSSYPGLPGDSTYILFVKDNVDCYMASDTITLLEPTAISITEITSTDTICYGAQATITIVDPVGGTGAYTYSVDSALTFPYSDPVITGLGSDIYNIAIKDANDCVYHFGKDTIYVSPEILVNSIKVVDPLCNGFGNDSLILNIGGGTGQLVISVDGGVSYTYSDDTITNLGPGSYDLYIMDSLSCIDDAGIADITDPLPLLISLKSSEDAACNGNSDGSISLSASGGTKPYEFTIDDTNFQTDSTFAGLAAGTYTIKIVDVNGCNESVADLSVNEPAELVISLVDSSNIIAGVPGNIIVSGTGGTTPYTYTLQPTGTQQQDDGTFSITTEGSYYVVLSDANGCDGGSISEITILKVGIGAAEYSTAKLYPNPSTGQVSLEFESNKAETNLEIVSIDGRLVYKTVLYSTGGFVNETFDLSDLQPGIYMIRLDQKPIPNGLMIR